MNTAVIKITPEDRDNCMDVKTNGVSNLDMLEHLQVLSKIFAQKIIDEAKEIGCSDDIDFDGYVEFLRKNRL